MTRATTNAAARAPSIIHQTEIPRSVPRDSRIREISSVVMSADSLEAPGPTRFAERPSGTGIDVGRGIGVDVGNEVGGGIAVGVAVGLGVSVGLGIGVSVGCGAEVGLGAGMVVGL